MIMNFWNTKKTTKYCEDCKWFNKAEYLPHSRCNRLKNSFSGSDLLLTREAILATGPKNAFADLERDHACGRNAKFFEAKQ